MTTATSTTFSSASGTGPRMPSWRQLLAEPTPRWIQVVGAVVAVLMLMCFYSVVNAAAQQAQHQQRADAIRADAQSYCGAMPDARDRASCAVQLGIESLSAK